MFENIKRLRTLKAEAREAVNVEYDANGKELLCMTVKRDDDFLSPYSLRGDSVVSAEVSEFLDNAVKRLPLNKELHIQITGDTIDEEESAEYSSALRNSYRVRVIETERKLKRNARAALLMALTAIIILAVYVALELSNAGYVLLELIDISAWVFMWEAVDLFFLERKALKIEQLRDCRIYGAEISYTSASGDNN